MAIQAGRVGVRADQVDAYGRVNDTSFFNKIIDKLITWVDLPVWKGGTEQLLPENDDEPETSPILCDIDYPDQEREDQYFIYRESPTGSDGIAKIEEIRGNTLVWNQLIQNGNFSDGTTGWEGYIGTISASDGILTLSASTASTATQARPISCPIITGHKYYVHADVMTSVNTTSTKIGYAITGNTIVLKAMTANVWDKLETVFTATETRNTLLFYLNNNSGGSIGDLNLKNVVFFDLTLMFGTGNEPATVGDFTSLFPLSYYKYDAGSLHNFTADKIKTVGFNLWDGTYTKNKWLDVVTGELDNASGYNVTDYIRVIPNKRYYRSATGSSRVLWYDANKNLISQWSGQSADSTYAPANALYIRITITTANLEKFIFNIYDNDRNGTYESYTTNTLELPISDFFPTGMKSAGSAYDELLPRRATTNIGSVDLGTLTWSVVSETPGRFYSESIKTDIAKISPNKKGNILCAIYMTDVYNNVFSMINDKTIAVNATGALCVYDSTYETSQAFKTAMSGITLNYELAEPIVLPTIDFGD